MFRYIKRKLFCEEVPIDDIDFPTPFYLYSTSLIKDRFNSYKEAFKEKKGTIIAYAYKANSNLSLLAILHKLGAAAEVNSLFELKKAKETHAKKIIFNGNGKTREELELAIDYNALINIDSIEEALILENIAKEKRKIIEVGVRINPFVLENKKVTHPHIACATYKSKFGIPISDVKLFLKKLNKLKHIKLSVLHMHIGSQIKNIAPFKEGVNILVNLAKELQDFNIKIEYLNIGGGLGIDYDSLPTHKNNRIKELIEEVIKLTPEFKLIVEPGRSIIGESGVIVSKVLYVKSNSLGNFLVIDAGMNNLIRPALYSSRHKIIPAVKHEERKKYKYFIVGPLCEESDFFCEDELQKIKEGEKLVILSCGAYGMAMASNYNGRPLAGELLVDGKQIKIIRKPQNYNDYISQEIL